MASVDLSSISYSYVSSYNQDLNNNKNHNYELEDAVTPQQTSIFGRSEETEILRNAYQNLTHSTKKQNAHAVIIHGESGSGKTALVECTLRDSAVLDSHGYFVTGKYAQTNQSTTNSSVVEPYSAIMAAFSDLCDLVVQSKDFDMNRREEIRNALGPSAPMLAKAITSLSSLLCLDADSKFDSYGEQAPTMECALTSFAKFKIACKIFLHVMASDAKHPIVLFLDDMQWADEGSQELVDIFLHDSKLQNILFVLAYRNDDELSQSMLQSMLLSRNILLSRMTELPLSNLNADGVYQVVRFIMLGGGPADNSATNDTNSNQIRKLSDLVAKRTCGNPLHVEMFIEAIGREGLLDYRNSDYDTDNNNNGGGGLWIFDVDKIQEEIMSSESLADLLARKMERLSGEIKEILKVASLLGYLFDEMILVEVASTILEQQHDPTNQNTRSSESKSQLITMSLSEAIKEGFIEKTSHGFQFTHDKLQAASQSFMNESEAPRLHALIGEAFLARADCDGDMSDMYKAAVHLNYATDFLQYQHVDQRIRLARINAEAAKYCEEKSAFYNATTMLQTGLDVLLPDERWLDENFHFTFEMMEALAKNQLIIGDLEGSKDTAREAISHGKTSEMSIKLQLIDVEIRMAGNEVEGALVKANEALKSLGVKMPRKAKMRHVTTKLLKVKWLLKQKKDDDILNLPNAKDSMTASAVKLLMHVCSYCLLKDEPDTAVFSALLAAELTLKNGLSEHSSSAFAIYGLAEASLGNTNQACRFGKIALAMLDRTQSREAECPTVGFALTMLNFYRQPLDELTEPLFQAAMSGYQHGDILYATYCLSQHYSMQFSLGTNLAVLEDTMRMTYGKVCDLGQTSLTHWLQPQLQYVINMQSDAPMWGSVSVLTGEIMNEDEYFEGAHGSKNAIFVLIGLVMKAHIALCFNQLELAASLYKESTSYGVDTLHFTHGGPYYYTEVARVQFGLYEATGKRCHLRKGRRYRRVVQRIDATGCPEASKRLAFLVAFEAILGKKSLNESKFRASYAKAIKIMDKEDVPCNLQAAFNEKVGFDFAKKGLHAEAVLYFERAQDLYLNEWGATAKYNQLQHESAVALSALKRDPTTIDSLCGTCIQVVSNESVY